MELSDCSQTARRRISRVCTATFVTSLLMFAAAAPAAAQMRAGELQWLCDGRGPVANQPAIGELACANYLAGVLDVVTLFSNAGMNMRNLCLPADGEADDRAVDVYRQWAAAHPERMRDAARVSVIFAMTEAFPCQE